MGDYEGWCVTKYQNTRAVRDSVAHVTWSRVLETEESHVAPLKEQGCLLFLQLPAERLNAGIFIWGLKPEGANSPVTA